MGSTQSSAYGCSFLPRRRVGQRHGSTLIHIQCLMFGIIVRDLEGTQSENWLQDNLGKRYIDRPLTMSTHMKIFVIYVKGEQRMTSAKEDSNNHLKSCYSVAVSESLSLATAVFAK